MMKLLLLRHGKSPHPNGIADRDRPLTGSAADRIRDMARKLAATDMLPERVLASSARRAARTAIVFCEAARLDPPELRDDLYLASENEILEILREAGGQARSLMLVGHNPGIEHCCARLTGTPLPGGRLRPGDMAILAFEDQPWSTVSWNEAELLRHITASPDP